MFLTGVLGAAVLYSLIHAHSERKRHSFHAFEQRFSELYPPPSPPTTATATAPATVPHNPSPPSPPSPPPQVVYPPLDTLRALVAEIVSERPCTCSKPEPARSFWSLDQGREVGTAGTREAIKAREQRKEEVKRWMGYWSLDRGMHEDVSTRG